jgi:hypothetical protein
MSAATACGCDTNTVWLPLTSKAVKPARLDINRWASGGIILSSVLITYQLGFVFQAGSVIVPFSASLQGGSCAHGRNGRDPSVDQEVCPDDVRRIVRREVNCQLRDFFRIGDPLAWIIGS